MFLFVVLFSLVLYILVESFRKQGVSIKEKYQYKCFMLTVKDAKERQEQFMKHYDDEIPLEIIYGPNTSKVKVAREFEHIMEPEYFEKALEMHYDPTVKRPNITFFNLGAIGSRSLCGGGR